MLPLGSKMSKTTSRKQRTFNRSEQLVHDLYKLNDAKAKKNVAWQQGMIQLEDITHVHFFHTIDSAGNPQETCVPINGHFHIMKMITKPTAKEPAVYECSPPMVWKRKRDPYTGRWIKTMAPANDYDTHTHDIIYKSSEIWKAQPTNAAAEAYMVAHGIQQPPSLDGVIES
jgi:hypothetical protein